MGKNSALVANTDQTLDLVLLIVPAKHLQLGQTHRDQHRRRGGPIGSLLQYSIYIEICGIL